MKNITLLAALLFLLAACQKEASLEDRKPPTEKILIEDDFGLSKQQLAANAKYKRPLLDEAKRRAPKEKPTHPHGKPPKGDNDGGGEEPPPPPDDSTGNDGGGDPPPPPPPAADTSEVIYVNFHGGVERGTAWNVQPEIVYGPSNLSYPEQQEVLARMRDDYREYKVKITDDSAAYAAADPFKRTQINVTETWQWYGQAGGVAYLNSFTWGQHAPAWVFSQLLGYSVKAVAEAASHEGGHTIGLRHQSTWVDWVKVEEYRRGTIMGVGYYDEPVYWTVGLNSSGVMQDDFALLSKVLLRSINGAYRLRHQTQVEALQLYMKSGPKMGVPDFNGHVHISLNDLTKL